MFRINILLKSQLLKSLIVLEDDYVNNKRQIANKPVFDVLPDGKREMKCSLSKFRCVLCFMQTLSLLPVFCA